MGVNVNRLELSGNVGGDPEVRTTASGSSVKNFSLAKSFGKKNKEGTWDNHPLWFNCVIWEDAEGFELIEKGAPVILFGKIGGEFWANKETGKMNSKQTFIVSNVEKIVFDKKTPEDEDDVPF